MKKFLYILLRILKTIPVLAIVFNTVTVSEYLPETRKIQYDIDSDGKVSQKDVAYILTLSSVSSKDIPLSVIKKADVDNDGRITAYDGYIVRKNLTTPSVIIQEAEPVVSPLVGNNFISSDMNGNAVPVIDTSAGAYNVISNEKMYIYPDLSQVMTLRDTFVIIAFGWGHGIGMSQWGAVGLARAGYSYIQIIQHYYRNVAIMKESPPPTVRCAGRDVDTVEMLARIVEKEIAGITNHNDPIDANALRAQAVAAYTNMKYDNYAVSGCSYVSSYSSCREDVKAVAREIAGQYMIYNNTVPYAFYSACSAGVAANYSDILGSTSKDMSYLYNSASYYDCYTKGYISAKAYSPQDIKNYIRSFDSSIQLSDNPQDWIRILRHDDAVNENIGYVSAMQIGNRTISEAAGIKFRNEIMDYEVKSPCFAIIYNGQYL
ncbi:MAG: hypothetical protein IKW03_10105 [Clostridia bacterium]|nr:hypothetical protein [Clostridia bacterium]